MKILIRVLLILLVIVFLAFIGAFVTWLVVGREAQEEVKIPDVTGKPFETAFDRLHGLGLEIEKKEKFNNSQSEGTVLNQFPEAGTMTRKKRGVILTISKGPQWIRVPSITLQDWVMAKNMLRQTGSKIYKHGGLNIGNISRMYSSTVARNMVIAQTPEAGTIVLKNTAVDILISLGPKPKIFFMPELTGTDYNAAMKQCEKLKLNLRQIKQREDDSKIPGTILEQTPRAGVRVEEGAPYTLTISMAKTPPSREEPRYLPFQYLVPPGQEPYRVRIMVEDLDGERQVYDDLADPSTAIYTSFKIRGNAKVTVYLDGLPQSTKTYE